MARYTFRVDDGDFAGVGKLFARGELVLNDNPPASGADAVEAFLTKSLRTYGDGTPRTHHVSSNIIIEIEGSCDAAHAWSYRSEEHTSELQSLMRISYAVFCLKKKKNTRHNNANVTHTTTHNSKIKHS